MKRNTNSSSKTRRLVLIGALGGISIFLGISGLGLIRLPIFSLTIMHVPVIIGALLEGPIVGIAVGLIFGLFSMYQNITAPGLTSFIFWNPIVALIPRMLIGIVAYYSFKLLKSKIKSTGVCAGFAAILGTLTNTIGVLGLTYILYLDRYAQAREISREAVAGTLLTVGLTNGVPEAIVSALITIPIVVTMLKIKRN
ncbi:MULTISPECIES: ECF transporter S component [unclassified Clostridium]|uniref:ECF transporter S component n=1 Tax=Clostridium TaxID=1485 RepID=UPI001C8CF228|nr:MULTISPECIES: ECF transporter S component [unclassified Clostridium]MBX9139026.1 ECF transporter S component [Clostridium sp. K12(2020)]MBX9145812.1 ECF transporter S component [Clostridium sp. K13]MDU2291383.1 ECF transporter S component [Clostridium celatum]MDU4324002.1 ECF transporter S component [Clostridium celatum]